MPGLTIELSGIRVKGVPAYNPNKKFHPKINQWLGFVVEIGGKRIYYAGDTDLTEEMKAILLEFNRDTRDTTKRNLDPETVQMLEDLGYVLNENLANINMERILVTGARTVITGCPYCARTFNNKTQYAGLAKNGIQVSHKNKRHRDFLGKALRPFQDPA